jgi:hypothetical protein
VIIEPPGVVDSPAAVRAIPPLEAHGPRTNRLESSLWWPTRSSPARALLGGRRARQGGGGGRSRWATWSWWLRGRRRISAAPPRTPFPLGFEDPTATAIRTGPSTMPSRPKALMPHHADEHESPFSSTLPLMRIGRRMLSTVPTRRCRRSQDARALYSPLNRK